MLTTRRRFSSHDESLPLHKHCQCLPRGPAAVLPTARAQVCLPPGVSTPTTDAINRHTGPLQSPEHRLLSVYESPGGVGHGTGVPGPAHLCTGPRPKHEGSGNPGGLHSHGRVRAPPGARLPASFLPVLPGVLENRATFLFPVAGGQTRSPGNVCWALGLERQLPRPGGGRDGQGSPAQVSPEAPTGQCSLARPRRPRDLRQPRASEHRLLRIARWHPRNHSPRCPARVLGAQFCPGSRPRRCLHPSDTGTAAISAGGLGERGGHGRDSRVHKQQRCEIPHGTGSALRPTSSPPAP